MNLWSGCHRSPFAFNSRGDWLLQVGTFVELRCDTFLLATTFWCMLRRSLVSMLHRVEIHVERILKATYIGSFGSYEDFTSALGWATASLLRTLVFIHNSFFGAFVKRWFFSSQLGLRDIAIDSVIRELRQTGLRITGKMLSDHRALLCTGTQSSVVCRIRTKDLLSEVASTSRALLLSYHHKSLQSLLQIVLAPHSFFIKLAINSLGVNFADLLHLQALFEIFELLEVFALQHLSDQEPMQIVLLKRHIWRLLLLGIGQGFNLALLALCIRIKWTWRICSHHIAWCYCRKPHTLLFIQIFERVASCHTDVSQATCIGLSSNGVTTA